MNRQAVIRLTPTAPDSSLRRWRLGAMRADGQVLGHEPLKPFDLGLQDVEQGVDRVGQQVDPFLLLRFQLVLLLFFRFGCRIAGWWITDPLEVGPESGRGGPGWRVAQSGQPGQGGRFGERFGGADHVAPVEPFEGVAGQAGDSVADGGHGLCQWPASSRDHPAFR